MRHRRALLPSSVSLPNPSSLTTILNPTGSSSGTSSGSSTPGGSSTTFSSSQPPSTSSTLTGSPSSPPSSTPISTISTSTSDPTTSSTFITTTTTTPLSTTTTTSTSSSIPTTTLVTSATSSNESGWTPYTTSTSYSTITSLLPDGLLTTYATAIPTALYSPPISSHSSSTTALIAGLTAGVVTLFLSGLGILWWRRAKRGAVTRREMEVKEREEKKWGLAPSNSIWRRTGGGMVGAGVGSSKGSRRETRRLLEDEDWDEEVKFNFEGASPPLSPPPAAAMTTPTGRRSVASLELLTLGQPPAQEQRQAGMHSRRGSLSASAALSRNSSHRDPFNTARSIADSASVYSQESAHGNVQEGEDPPPVPPLPVSPIPEEAQD